jgi:superfamily II DNA or RNA helicase
MELRPYQHEAVAAIAREHERVRSTLLVLATGLGKTVTFAAIARDLAAHGGRTLVLAHRAELLEQAAETLRKLGLRAGIEQAARSVGPLEQPDAIVASVQTLQRGRLAAYARDAFRLVVVDECQHATSDTYRAILDYFAPAKVLGVTATPDRGDGVGLRAVFESVAYRFELRDGIKAGWLAPLEVRAVEVKSLDLSKVKVRAGDLAADELEAELLRDAVLHEIAGPLAELSAGRQTLAFTVGVAQAHALADVLRARGVAAAAVDGAMSDAMRAKVLADYRAKRVTVVCNAMLWTEGFDDPATACIALVRPTGTRALIAQMIGRGTRTAPGKTSCLVLDFVPGRMSRMRLASPRDVLGGEDLPVEPKQDKAERKEKERVLLALERRRWIREVGVVYAAPHLDVAELLEALGVSGAAASRSEVGLGLGSLASPRQVEALRAAGFEVADELDKRAAMLLFGVLSKRRAAGLCTIKQARALKRHGFDDELSAAQASRVLDALAASRWRMPTAARAQLMADVRRESRQSTSSIV